MNKEIKEMIKNNGAKMFCNLVNTNRKQTIKNIEDGIYKESDVKDVTKAFYDFLVQKEIGIEKEDAKKIAAYACAADKI